MANTIPTKEAEGLSGAPEEVVMGIEAAESESQDKPETQKLRLPLVLTLSGALFLSTLSIQSSVIILPSIGRDLGIPAERQEWFISSFYLSYGCFLLLWGRLADVYGRRPIFLLGSTWLACVTLVIPFVRNEILLDTLRGLQGLGAAANVPTALGIIGATFQPGRARNYAFAIYSAGSSCGSVLGNIFGGLVGEYASWKWTFWIIAILAAAITVCGQIFIPPSQPIAAQGCRRPDIDWIGGATITVALILLNFALSEGTSLGWGVPWVPVLLVAAVATVGLFATWKWYLETKTARSPLLRLAIFRNLPLNAALVIVTLFFAAFNNFLVDATYFYQDYQRLSVIQTTLRFIPTGVVGVFASFLSAPLMARLPAVSLVATSTLFVATSCLLMAVPIAPTTTYWAYGFPAMVLSTLGTDILYPTIVLFMAQSLPPADQALAGALATSMIQMGRATGLAIATVVQTSVQRASGSPLQGLRSAQWLNFGLAMAAGVVTLCGFRVKRKLGAVADR